MIGSIAVDLNRLPTAKVERPDAIGTRKADEACLETIGVFLEPTLDDLLSEPIIAALMRADSVDPAVLKATIRERAALTLRHAPVADCTIGSTGLAGECKPRIKTRDAAPGSIPLSTGLHAAGPLPLRTGRYHLICLLKRDPCQVPQVSTETVPFNS